MIIWLASYPRSGNTFFRVILNSAFNLKSYSLYNDKLDIAADSNTAKIVGHEYLPENYNIEEARASKKLHLIKTHDYPVNDQDKVIYLIRDGRESTLSYLNYKRDYYNSTESLLDLIHGAGVFGGWGEHVSKWDPINRPNTLVIKFEELVDNPSLFVSKISQFINVKPKRKRIPNFKKLNDINPIFFRQGLKDSWKEIYTIEEHLTFWMKNYRQMTTYGYEDKKPPVFENEQQVEPLNIITSQYAYYAKSLRLDFENLFQHVAKSGVEFKKLASDYERQLEASLVAISERDQKLEASQVAIFERDLKLEASQYAISERDQKLEAFQVAISERDQKLEAFQVAISERDQMLEASQVAISERNQKLEASRVAISERDQMLEASQVAISERNQKLEASRVAISERDQKLEVSQVAISERDQKLTESQIAISERDQKLTESQIAISERDQKLEASQVAIAERDQKLEASQVAIAERDQKLQEFQASIIKKDTDLQEIEIVIGKKNQSLKVLEVELENVKEQFCKSLHEHRELNLIYEKNMKENADLVGKYNQLVYSKRVRFINRLILPIDKWKSRS